jgi:ArsR family transcriptional regulator
LDEQARMTFEIQPPADGIRHEDVSYQKRVAALAKALAHPARVRIVETLLRRQTCMGCDIVEEIGLAASTTSEHLRILKGAGIIIGEITPPRVCYSLNSASLAPLSEFLKTIEAGSPPALPE